LTHAIVLRFTVDVNNYKYSFELICTDTPRLTKPGGVGDHLHPGFNEITLFPPKGELLVVLSFFVSQYFFYQ